MDSPTLYITGFDDATTQHEIVEVLSMSSPCIAQRVLALAPPVVSSQDSLPTSTEHSLCVRVTFRNPLALVQFLDDSSTPPHLMTEAIGAVLALNGSKVVPRRCISSANSWSPEGLRVVLEPSHLSALSQYPSLKNLVDAYPAVYSPYLSPDSLTSLGSALSGQLTVAHTNRAMLTTISPLPPTPETPSTALEHPLSEDRPRTLCPGHIFPSHGGILRLTSAPLLVPGSDPFLSAEYEDQGMVSLSTDFFSTDDLSFYQEGVNLAFQASQISKVVDPGVPPRQAELDTLEAQSIHPTAMLQGVADPQDRVRTVEEAYAKTRQILEVTEVQLVRQNTEYMSVLGQLSEERKMHEFTLNEMRETHARKLQDAERLAKDACGELDAFKNDDRDATRLLRDAKFHERQCLKAGESREQAEAELKKLRVAYEQLSQEHNALLKDERVTTKGALAAATQQLEQARAENQASTNQLTAANARVTELELKLDSSEHNVAMKTSGLKKLEQSLISLSHHLADICRTVNQEKATAQACSDKKLRAATELINELQEKKSDIEGALNEEHKQTIKDLNSQLADRRREINCLQDLQATVQAELEATRGELFCEKAKTTSISNERDEKQAMVISLQLSLKNEREEGRVLKEDLAVERTKKRELEAELIESREKVKALEEDKQRLETQVKIAEAAGDSLRGDVLNGIQVYETNKKRPHSDVLGVGSSGRPTKRPFRNRSSSEALVGKVEPFE